MITVNQPHTITQHYIQQTWPSQTKAQESQKTQRGDKAQQLWPTQESNKCKQSTDRIKCQGRMYNTLNWAIVKKKKAVLQQIEL